MKSNEEIRKFLEDKNGYFNVRFISGGVIGLRQLMYTTALFMGMDEYGYERRYCYESRELAIQACNAIVDIDDKPLEGYVAKRGTAA